MEKYHSLQEILQHLSAKSYQSYTQTGIQSNETIHSDDWRLDAVYQVRQEPNRHVKILVIAVSSAKKDLKLFFQEEWTPQIDFTPMTLLRRLFPLGHRRDMPKSSS